MSGNLEEKFGRFIDIVMERHSRGIGGGDSMPPSSSSSSPAASTAGANSATTVSVGSNRSDPMQELNLAVEHCFVRQNPQYTIAALAEGIYIIGMKDQFNKHDLTLHPLRDHVEYVADDMGFVLFSNDRGAGDRRVTLSVDTFGPYFIEQYILMEVLSKQEVAQNVLEYYVRHKAQLQSSLATYSETQGQGFVCWRFLMANEAVKKAAERKDS